MKAILELNDFQKIIDINKPESIIKMYYLDPRHVVSLYEVDPREVIEMNVLYFKLRGQAGEFLVYECC